MNLSSSVLTETLGLIFAWKSFKHLEDLVPIINLDCFYADKYVKVCTVNTVLFFSLLS